MQTHVSRDRNVARGLTGEHVGRGQAGPEAALPTRDLSEWPGLVHRARFPTGTAVIANTTNPGVFRPWAWPRPPVNILASGRVRFGRRRRCRPRARLCRARPRGDRSRFQPRSAQIPPTPPPQYRFLVCLHLRVLCVLCGETKETVDCAMFGSVDQRDFVRVDVVQHVVTGNQVPVVV